MNAFLHIWPYLLVTIPLAVAVQMSGASKYVKRAFEAKPLTAIVLATVVGAFSPLCSCGIIPVIASLLISGVPLAPVMSFWIASPSMDPEIFFLSVGMIGWELAVWRLAATLLMSFSAGLITHFLIGRNWLGHRILKSHNTAAVPNMFDMLKKGWDKLKSRSAGAAYSEYMAPTSVPISASQIHLMAITPPADDARSAPGFSMCTTCASDPPSHVAPKARPARDNECCSRTQDTEHTHSSTSFRMRLLKETLAATWMVGKFMALAFLLEGLITLYIPESWISGSLGSGSPLTIVTAALLGVPAYTTSLTALPMISGLLNQGMNPAAALAFLIAGPVTTLPAMAAVWPLVSQRIFGLYVSISLLGAVSAGCIYNLFKAIF